MQRFAALAAAVPLAYALRPAAARTKPLTKRHLGTLMDLLGGGGGELIAPEKALPGRKETMPNIEGSKHFVLGTDQVKVPDGASIKLSRMSYAIDATRTADSLVDLRTGPGGP